MLSWGTSKGGFRPGTTVVRVWLKQSNSLAERGIKSCTSSDVLSVDTAVRDPRESFPGNQTTESSRLGHQYTRFVLQRYESKGYKIPV
jgi:hypothetical protein